MSNSTQAVRDDMKAMAEDARALITSTADLGGEKVKEARQRLSTALERGEAMCQRVRDQALAGVKAADEAVHRHPYQALGVACGVGALIGYLLAHRRA